MTTHPDNTKPTAVHRAFERRTAMHAARMLLAAAAAALALSSCARAAPLGVARPAERGRWRLEAPLAPRQPGVELQRLSPYAAAAPPVAVDSGPAPVPAPAPAIEAGLLSDADAVEEGGLFEGDIILTPDEVEWLKRLSTNGSRARDGRNLVASRRQLWPGGVVYYDWGGEFSNITHRRYILSALKDIERHSCVRFRKRTTQKTYLLLRNTRSGCAAPVGYVPIGRPIDLYLGQPGCQRRGTVQHEFLHTLGFWHEHTRPDRDEHVTVQWSNIKPGLEFNFFVRPAKDVQYLRMPYDFESVMHYRSVAFSKDGRSNTLEPKEPQALQRMGQRLRFSKIDLAKLNRLYNCPPPYYRGYDVEVKKKKPSLYSISIAERISSKEEEETSEEWQGPFPLNTTWEVPISAMPVPPPLPEISTSPPSTELPNPPKLPTPSPMPAPPLPSPRPPSLPESTILPLPSTPPALPESTKPPAPILPFPEPPKLPTLTVQPAPSPLPEPPCLPETFKLPGVLEPSPVPTPEIVVLPPSPLTKSPGLAPPPPALVPPLPSIPPPPPLLPLPTLSPPAASPSLPTDIPTLASTLPPFISLLPFATTSPASGATSASASAPAPAPAPAPVGPVYIIEEKTADPARALQRAHAEAALAAHSSPALVASAAERGQRTRRETAFGAARANETSPEKATALVQLFQHLAGISSWKPYD